MSKMRGGGTRTLLLLIPLTAVAGCASTHLVFDKPGVDPEDRNRDQSACVRSAIVTESQSILVPTIDRDVVARCMEARGYTVVTK